MVASKLLMIEQIVQTCSLNNILILANFDVAIDPLHFVMDLFSDILVVPYPNVEFLVPIL